MYKHLYSRFLQANPGVLHFAAHSHHYWPDVTRDAHLRYWDDSARWVDRKWEHIFEQIIPQAQIYIAETLQTGQPKQIVFAPNTHELVCRLLSCFPERQPLRVLTTDSEFYSFDRQIRRLEEVNEVDVVRVGSEPFETFEQRLIDSLRADSFDLVYLSSVFFNSGYGLPKLDGVAEVARDRNSVLVVDGYHEFGALPINLSSVHDDLFYLSGGYKYVQSGEGVCFMHVPLNHGLTPTNTGWFAEFADLAARRAGAIGFAEDGWRFAGATFDPSGLYRFNAVMQMLQDQGLTPETIHQFVRGLQLRFLNEMDQAEHPQIRRDNLIESSDMKQGHFVTIDLREASLARELIHHLAKNRIICDARGSRIRIGFGLYQDEQDVVEFFDRIR